MHVIALAWLYVVLMMALVEAFSPQGSVLGAFFTLVGYGLLPVGLLLYFMAAPLRRKRRDAALQSAQDESPADTQSEMAVSNPSAATVSAAMPGASAVAPDGSGQPAGHTVTAIREKT